MKTRILFGVGLLFLNSLAGASEPCGPYSWFSNQKKDASFFAAHADWIAVAKLKAVDEKKVPFPNCYLEDRSKCAMIDASKLSLDVIRWEKSKNSNPPKTLKIQADMCASDPPKELGATFRIYGNSEDYFSYTEKIR